jgi:hypothetical protein
MTRHSASRGMLYQAPPETESGDSPAAAQAAEPTPADD